MFSFWRRYVIIKIIELRLIHNYSLLRISLSISVLIIECNSHRYQLVIIVVSILKMGKLRLRIVKSHSRSHWDQSGKDYSSRPRNFFPWAVTNWYLLLIFFFCYCDLNLWFGRWEIWALLLNTIQQSLRHRLVFFWDCISLSWPGWPWTHSVAQADPPNSVGWGAGITGLCHQAQWYLPFKKKLYILF